jgi:hypothetical protein
VGLIFGPLFVVGPLLFGVWMLSLELSLASIALAALFFGLSIFFVVMLHNNFQWVELDGETIRGRRFVTRILVEQNVNDLTQITTFYSIKSPYNALADALYGDVRGYALEFRSGPGLYLGKLEMRGAEELIAAVRRIAPPSVIIKAR